MINKSTISYLSFALIGILCIVLGCEDDERLEFDTRPNKVSQPGGAIASSRIVSINGDTLTLELELYIFDRFGIPITDLVEADIAIESNSNLNFSLNGLDYREGQEDIAYDAAILIDQSGSMTDNDPLNLRITAGKDFLSKLGEGDQVVLGAFAGNSWDLFGDLTPNGEEYIDDLDNLEGREGGDTPLFFSTYEMISYIAQNGNNVRKAVITLTDGQNTEGGANLFSVINHAIDNDVRLYTVGLSRDVDFDVLSDMATATGGAFMWAAEAPQLLSMFGTLGRLLEGSADTYVSTWTLTSNFGSYRSGQRVSGTVQVVMPSGYVFDIPFSVVIP